MAKISVVINAQNVEPDLPRVLASVKNFADEIVVVDQGSTDKTSEIAKKYGAKIYNHESVEYVEKTRNFAISKASNEWVLILDPDEEVPSTLKTEIAKKIKTGKVDYFRIPRKNIIFGKWISHSLWWPDYQIRLFKKGKVSWSEIIHSVPITTGKGADFPIREDMAILHHNYDSMEEYLERLNRYTTVQSKLLAGEGYKFVWQDLIKKPLTEFIRRYFIGEGYKDGIHGLALALLQSFSELSLYIKVWQKDGFKEENVEGGEIVSEMRKAEKELHFWQNDFLYKETGRIKYKIGKKLKI